VKARQEKGRDGGWHMDEKHERLTSPSLIYCFVDFGKTLKDHTRTWVVPSVVVAEAVAASHQAWLKLPGKRGKPHRDNPFRRFVPSWEDLGLTKYGKGWLDPYYENWKLLETIARK
jgi:hypothetical protein